MTQSEKLLREQRKVLGAKIFSKLEKSKNSSIQQQNKANYNSNFSPKDFSTENFY